MKNKPKFEIGQKVNYLPKLSGLRNKNLEIENYYFKENDSICELLGVTFKPTWIYFFKNSNLSAQESDLK